MRDHVIIFFIILLVQPGLPGLLGQEKIGIYLTDAEAWEEGMVSSSETTREAIEEFLKLEQCGNYSAVMKRSAADYAFIFGPGAWWSVRNVTIVSLKAGETIIYSGKAGRFKNVVKDACDSVTRNLG